MPEGNVPSGSIELDNVPNKDGQFGSYGPVMFERTRLGLNNLLYLRGANRGDRVTIQGWHYVSSEAAAFDHIRQTEAKAGTEVTLKSLLDGFEKMVFIHRINGARRPIGTASVRIGGSSKTVSWRVIYTIELQRTF